MDFADILTMTEVEYTTLKNETNRYGLMRARVQAFCDQLPNRRCYKEFAQYLRDKAHESEASKEELLWLAEQDKLQSTLEYFEHKMTVKSSTPTLPTTTDDRPQVQQTTNAFKVPQPQQKTITLKRLLSTTTTSTDATAAKKSNNGAASANDRSLFAHLDGFDEDDEEWSIVATDNNAAVAVGGPPVSTTTIAASDVVVIGGTTNDRSIPWPSTNSTTVATTTAVFTSVTASTTTTPASSKKTVVLPRASLHSKQTLIDKYLNELTTIVTTLDRGKTLRMYSTYVQINNTLTDDGKEKKSLFKMSSSFAPQLTAIVGHYRKGDKVTSKYHHRNVVVVCETCSDVNEVRKRLRVMFKAGQEHRNDFETYDGATALTYFMIGQVNVITNKQGVYQLLCGNGLDDEMDDEFCKSVNEMFKSISFVE